MREVKPLRGEIRRLFPPVKCEPVDLDDFFGNKFFQDCVNAIRREALAVFENLKLSDKDKVERQIGLATGLLEAVEIINTQARLQARESEQSRKET